MSKIGKQPIPLPEKVDLELVDNVAEVKGPKGSLKLQIPRGVKVSVDERVVNVSIAKITKNNMSLHGTVRAILANMVKGVVDGWQKQLELVGTGYRAEVQGNTLVLTVGYINPVKMLAPEGIVFTVEKNIITVSGTNKEVVGEIAAKIRAVRPPEPYQGKGIRYLGEEVRKKPGKAAKAAAGAAA